MWILLRSEEEQTDRSCLTEDFRVRTSGPEDTASMGRLSTFRLRIWIWWCGSFLESFAVMLRSELYRCRIYNKEQKQTAEEKSEIKTSGSVRINREVGDEVFTDAVQ